jgi:hypothetical protein
MGIFRHNLTGFEWFELLQRIDRIEEKVFKKKKIPTTLNQQVLLLHHLGMLQKINELPITSVKKAELLSVILNGDASNTKKALEGVAKRKESPLRIPFNYEYLKELFESFGLVELSSKMNNVLKEIHSEEKGI